MKIIIIGNGKVGFALAKQLAGESHDLVLIDQNVAALHQADSTLDVLCLEGNGASINVLLEAGVRQADLAIAVTGYDEVNIMCCLIAKKLGAQHTVARIRNPEYFDESSLLKREVGLDMIIIPGDTTPAIISGIIADEAAIGMVNSKTTAVRVIPAVGRKEGETLTFGGLLGYGPVIKVNRNSPEVFINRGGHIPAPLQSLKN